MSKNPISLSLDFHQWGAVLASDLARLGNFVNNFTSDPMRFGPIDASVVAEFHDHLDKMKVMATAWAAAYQRQAGQSPTSSSEMKAPPPPPISSTSSNGAATQKVKKKPGRPKKIVVEKRERLLPRAVS